MYSARHAVLALALPLAISGCEASPQQETQIGQQESAQVEQQLPMLNDADINGYVNDLGNRIAKLTPRTDLEWHFAVVNTDVVNAFALPGGYIYVNRGVLDHARNESELAGVLGHEIEHVVLRHSVKQMAKVEKANVGIALACALTRICGHAAAQVGINVAGSLVFAKFSRDDERQADEGGFDNVVRAGINPTGMLTFFQALLDEEKKNGGGATLPFFSDHPGTTDRIADIKRMLSLATPQQLQQLETDTPEFDAMKAKLTAMPPAPVPAQPAQ